MIIYTWWHVLWIKFFRSWQHVICNYRPPWFDLWSSIIRFSELPKSVVELHKSIMELHEYVESWNTMIELWSSLIESWSSINDYGAPKVCIFYPRWHSILSSYHCEKTHSLPSFQYIGQCLIKYIFKFLSVLFSSLYQRTTARRQWLYYRRQTAHVNILVTLVAEFRLSSSRV